MTVDSILELHATDADILRAYPQLTPEHLQAAKEFRTARSILIQYLTRKFFLFPRVNLVVSVLGLVGITAATIWATVKTTLSQTADHEAQRQIQGLRDSARQDFEAIHAMKERGEDGAPIGTIVAFAGVAYAGGMKQQPPKGWLYCDGQALSSRTYDKLFQIIKNNWGTGDGQSASSADARDFNLPDLRGMFLRGIDEGRGLDKDANLRKPIGRGTITDVGTSEECSTAPPKTRFTTDTVGALPPNVPMYVVGHKFGTHQNGSGNDCPDGHVNVTDAIRHSHVVTGGGDRETRPENVSVSWIIRAE